MTLGADFDHCSVEQVTNPFPMWKALRDHEPVARSERHGGFYVLTRYTDVRLAAQDTETFSSAGVGTGIPPQPFTLIPIDTDPPDQHDYRTIINPAFTAAAVAADEKRIRSVVVSLIEPLTRLDEFEVVSLLARPFPPMVTLSFLGFPDDVREAMTRAIDDLTHLRGLEQERIAEASAAVLHAITVTLEARRADPSSHRGDLLDTMLRADFQGRPLTDLELTQLLLTLLFGAIETTATALAGSLLYLATHRDVQQRLRGQRPIPHTAVEELIRWVSPLQALARTVTKDTEIGGCPLRQGDRVLLHWAAANQDERVFPDPAVVDLERRPNKHVAFGFGPHHCVGAHLGRLMLRVGLEEFLSRVGPFTVAEPSEIRWSGGEARSLARLRLQVS
jgi:cytochrome P450